MRGQLVPPGTRQIVDKQFVAKIVLPLPVNAVRLERVAAVRAEDYQPAAGFPRDSVWASQHTYHLPYGQHIIRNVFQYLVAEHQVEGPSGIGQVFACGIDDTR